MTDKKMAYSIQEATKILSIGKTRLYEEIKYGNLKALKFGKRTLITADALNEWLSSLPLAQEAK